MLVAFTLENFRSFKGVQTINLFADSGSEHGENTFSPEGIAGLEGTRLLKSIAIYGANGSGKSNIIKAFSYFFHLTNQSATEGLNVPTVGISPFLLDTESASNPTTLSATFVVEGVVYEYSFSVRRDTVVHEELTAFPKKIGRQLFRRVVDEEGVSHWHFSRAYFHRDKKLEERTRKDALFLSVAAQWNHPQLVPIHQWASSRNYLVLVGDDYRQMMRRVVAEKCVKDKQFSVWARNMLQAVDPSLAGIQARMRDNTKRLPAHIVESLADVVRKQLSEMPHTVVFHRLMGSKELVKWDLNNESDGTKQLFGLLNTWYAMLKHGMTGVVDELDSSLHPMLSRWLLEMVNSESHNPLNGQLIFTTHDTTLLDSTLMRRDQVYLVNKDASGASSVYPVTEFKPRKDEALQKGYLAGRYGGIPFLERLDRAHAPSSEESE